MKLKTGRKKNQDNKKVVSKKNMGKIEWLVPKVKVCYSASPLLSAPWLPLSLQYLVSWLPGFLLTILHNNKISIIKDLVFLLLLGTFSRPIHPNNLRLAVY